MIIKTQWHERNNPRNLFSIPLDNDEYGYVNYEGRILMVNLFDFKSSNPKDLKMAFESPLLMKDWLIDWFVFSKIGGCSYPKWKLHRNVILENYQKPQYPYVIIGTDNNLKCVDFLTGKSHPASEEEAKNYTHCRFFYVDYYHQFVRAKHQGLEFSKLIFDEEKQRYVPV